MFDHLYLRRWPFVVVPEPRSCDFIADRENFRVDVDKLLRSLSRQNISTVHPIWSWFGAGKTHTLHFLSNQAEKITKQGNSILRSVYSEFPQNPKNFVDLYKSFASKLDTELLKEAYLEIYTSTESERMERELQRLSSDLARALRILVVGEPQNHETVMRWLRAEALPINECRNLGITRKISTSEDASRILTGIVRMFGLFDDSQNRNNSRLIWLLDELQRINQQPKRVRDEINTGLHSVFNSCPTGFSMILSFSGRPENRLPDWLSPELKDRIGRTKFLILPPMQTTDALKFVKDLLANSRTEENLDLDPYFPFSEDACRFIIEDIEKYDELKPRAIMHHFNAVLTEAEFHIEHREIEIITVEFAHKILSELPRVG